VRKKGNKNKKKNGKKHEIIKNREREGESDRQRYDGGNCNEEII
jgi:hypothetical protein